MFDLTKTAVFSGFLFLASWQDLRRKKVDLWIFWLGGFLALFLCAWRSGKLLGDGAEMTAVFSSVLMDCAAGSLLGVILLAGKKCIGDGIGAGDGWFFVISGLMLGFWENLLLFGGATLLCGIWALAYSCWKQLRGKGWGRKETLPFLPFAALAWAGLILPV